jgi:hypothetical protein
MEDVGAKDFSLLHGITTQNSKLIAACVPLARVSEQNDLKTLW